MEKQTVEFAVITENGVINQVGKSIILQPKICFKGGSIPWFDDTKLLKKDCNKKSASDG